MPESSSNFIGNIPENYDRKLGPNIFVDYAADLAARVSQDAPARVLELAAGTGIVSRKLRDALPGTTDLVVTDLNPPMLEIAQAKFTPAENVDFHQADAMALPFQDAAFDTVACQFGVMFFPDKIGSYREVARVLRPGGTYFFSTWAELEENRFSYISNETSKSFFPSDPPTFYKVPFSCADAGAVLSDLRVAGFPNARVDIVRLEKTVADPMGFAQGLVYGNPFVDEIRARGGIDPEDVVEAIHLALLEEFGRDPTVMHLKANVFTCPVGAPA